MERFWQAAAAVMVAVMLWIVVSRQGKDFGLLLSIAVCSMVLAVMGRFLEPVVDLLRELEQMGNLQPQWLQIMLKSVGIGMIVEITSLICADAGNSALGKALQILGSGVILWLAIPLFQALLELLQQILGEI